MLKSTTQAGKVAELKGIRPIDSLDTVCQEHDICYATFGVATLKCDDTLVAEVLAMNFEDYRCAEIARNIGAFAISNPEQASNGRPNLNLAVNAPLATMGNIIGIGAVAAMQASGAMSTGEPQCISGSGQWRVHMLQ